MDDEARLAEHLKTLSICHHVYAGLAACGSCFGGIYLAIGLTVPEMIRHAPKNQSQPMPEEVGKMFSLLFGGVGVAIIVLALTLATLCFLSGRAIARHDNRTLSLVVAGIVCLTGVLGVVLGVFTFVLLLKPEAERLYARAAGGDPPPI
jgi:MFS family permease